MYNNLQKRTDPESKKLRLAGGLWLKELRERAGLSQRGLAEKVDLGYYTFVSQLENGRGRLPPDRYEVWAEALNIDRKAFIQELMRYYDPVTHRLLFEDA